MPTVWGAHEPEFGQQRYTLIEGCFARVDATRALLNLVGWTHFPVKGEVEVDLAQHRQALRGALSARPTDDTLASDLVIALRALMEASGAHSNQHLGSISDAMMEPTRLNANRFASLAGGRMSLDEAD